MNLMTKGILATVLATALALPAFAVERKDAVQSIDVAIDIAAVQNAQAAQYWGGLQKDLQTAILTRVADRTAEEGAMISIDLDEVALANGFEQAMGMADARLSGLVKVSDPTQPGRGDSYELSVDINAVRTILGPDYDITAEGTDTSVAYRAMVDTFADQVVKNLK